jgi:multisubunit Na+/H+ antiporter MnhB subunit
VERLREHLGIYCIVLGVVLIVFAALLDPGGTMAGALVKETAAAVLTVVIYLVLRRQTRRST